MQPYFLPYIGYWQLLASVDRFVFLDEVNYINRGWINRNRIPIQKTEHWITVPLVKASQNRPINDIEIQQDEKWRSKMTKTIRATYGKAPYFPQGMELFERILAVETTLLSEFLAKSILLIRDYLELSTEIFYSSGVKFEGPRGTGQKRIQNLCQALEADAYHNLSGGKELYDKLDFEEKGICLKFLETHWTEIDLSTDADNLGYSIIDLLMHNSKQRIRRSLDCCDFV